MRLYNSPTYLSLFTLLFYTFLPFFHAVPTVLAEDQQTQFEVEEVVEEKVDDNAAESPASGEEENVSEAEKEISREDEMLTGEELMDEESQEEAVVEGESVEEDNVEKFVPEEITPKEDIPEEGLIEEKSAEKIIAEDEIIIVEEEGTGEKTLTDEKGLEAEEIVEGTSEEEQEEIKVFAENDDGSLTTVQNVEVGHEYEYKGSGFKIEFTHLDLENSGKITIRKIKLSDEGVEKLNAISDVAYEVTSEMENGTFEYTITLPIEDTGVDVQIAYADSEEELIENPSVMDDEIDLHNDSVVVEGLDHFTFFALAEMVKNGDSLFPSKDECEGKVHICHATSSQENPYILPCAALYGGAQGGGHLNENGTPAAGHEDDVPPDPETGLCPGQEPEDPEKEDETYGIVGYKYEDINGNKEIDDGDTPIEGWEVKLCKLPNDKEKGSDECEVIATTTTDANGMYSFTGLEPGQYKIIEEDRDGYLWVIPSSGEYIVDIPEDASLITSNLIINGGFEYPEVKTDAGWAIFKEDKVVWNVAWYKGHSRYNRKRRPKPRLELQRDVQNWKAAEGEQYAELDTDWEGPNGDLTGEPASVKISQSEDVLCRGAEYTLSYYWSPRPEHNDNKLRVKWNGKTIRKHSAEGKSNTDWKYVEITGLSSKNGKVRVSFTETGRPDSLGMFLDGVQVVQTEPCEEYSFLNVQEQVCEEGEAWAYEVIENNRGTKKDGSAVDPNRSDPDEALGPADSVEGAIGNFFSLGKDGNVVFAFEYSVLNVEGDDLSFHEETWDDRFAYGEEKANVYVKQLITDEWRYVGEVSNHALPNGVAYLDFANTGFSWIQFVKLEDTTDYSEHNGSADGYDIDAIDAVYSICEVLSPDPTPEPHCGDGIVNQEIEECDGDDGVGDDEFCTSQCKLIPIYDGEHQCPVDTTQVYAGTITLDSYAGNVENVSFVNGKSYLLEASGVYRYANNLQRKADAAYGTTNNFSSVRSDIGIWGVNKGVTSILGDFGRGMGVIEWDDDQVVNANHIYSKLIVPESDMIAEFVISDWYDDWYVSNCNNQSCLGDNTGSLDVDVYECVESILPVVPVCDENVIYAKITTDYTDNIWYGGAIAPKNGWFELTSGAETSPQTEGAVLTYNGSDLTIDLLKRDDNAHQGFSGIVEFYSTSAANLTEGTGFYKLENMDNCGAACYMDVFEKENISTVRFDLAVTSAHDRGIITLEHMGCGELEVCANDFSVNNNRALSTIDLSSGNETPVALLEFGSSAAASDLVTGDVYYIERHGDRLAYYDISERTNHIVGNTGITSIIDKMAFDADGILYAMSTSSELFTVNVLTGFATSLGTISEIGNPGGDIAFDNMGDLYAHVKGGNLYRINLSNLTAVVVNDTDIQSTGMVFKEDGNFYASDNSNRLFFFDDSSPRFLIGSTNVINDLASCPVKIAKTDVTVCKYDTDKNPLSGWNLQLLGEYIENVMIPTNNGISVYSSDLPEDDYALVASGTYKYRGSFGLLADANYSQRLEGDQTAHFKPGTTFPYWNWANVNDFKSAWEGYLGIMVGGSATNWSNYLAADNRYALGYTSHSGMFDFRVLDSQYADNVGDLTVDIFKGYASTTGEDGCVIFEDVPYGEYEITETLKVKWENVSGLEKVVVEEDNNEFVIVNRDVSPITLIAHKIVCEKESDLPNWGKGGPNITEYTAQKYVNDHKSCWLESDWNFQWGYMNARNPGDEFYGEETVSGNWYTFGPTDVNGMASVQIDDLTDAEYLWGREVLKDGYIPFTYGSSGNSDANNVSAEFYCNTDVYHYDNWDRIDNIRYGNTYYCIGFNVSDNASISGYKFEDKNENGNWDEGELGLSGWQINLCPQGEDKEEVLQSCDTTTTDENGYYEFKTRPGEYFLSETFQNGWNQTVPEGEGYKLLLNPEDEIGRNFGNHFQTSRVMVCKMDEYEVPLSNWNVYLLGDHIEEVTVNPDGNTYSSRDLAEGDYVLLSDGTYEYRGGSGLLTDTNYSQRLESDGYTGSYFPWINVNDFNTPHEGWLGIMINGSATNWSDYLASDHKYALGYRGYSGIFDFNILDDYYPDNKGNLTVNVYTGYAGITGDDGCATFEDVPYGDYEVGEVLKENWEFVEGDDKVSVDEKQETFYLMNRELFGNLQVCKFNDLNGDGKWGGEPTLEWGVHVEGQEDSVLDEDMCYTWFELKVGEYTVYEDDRDGWVMTTDNNYSSQMVLGGKTTTVNFGNHEQGKLSQAKINNVNNGAITSKSGETVTYTITVSAHNNFVNDVIVQDLPPGGFTYQLGSWTAHSNVRGDLKGLGITPEPVYASPGVWNLGDMVDGEVIELTYIAKISDGQVPGLYKDLAWAEGTSQESKIIAEAESTGYVDEFFVGTAAKVIEDPESPEVDVDIEEEEEIVEVETEGKVLGVSTLPATGSSTIATIIGFLGLAFGVLLIIASIAMKCKKKIVLPYFGRIIGLIIMMLFAFNVESAFAAPSSMSVRIFEPDSKVISAFALNFVALDIEDRTIAVTCYKKGPSDATFVTFDSVKNLIAGGDTANCNVSSSVLTTDGIYEFKVSAKAGTDTLESDTVSTKYDSKGPDKPTKLEIDQKDDCKYKIEFKTANDGETSYVEVYRDDSTSFSVGNHNRVKTITISPDQEYSYTDEVAGSSCGKKQYYAIRAFDDAANPSDVRAQKDVIIIEKEVEGESTGDTTGGAIIVDTGTSTVVAGGVGGANVIAEGEEGTEVEKEGETELFGEEGEFEDGEVLGEADSEKSSKLWLYGFLALLALGLIAYVVKKTGNSKGTS